MKSQAFNSPCARTDGRPLKTTSFYQTPEQQISVAGDRDSLASLPFRTSVDGGLEAEIEAIGLNGVEALSPIAALVRHPSPSIVPLVQSPVLGVHESPLQNDTTLENSSTVCKEPDVKNRVQEPMSKVNSVDCDAIAPAPAKINGEEEEGGLGNCFREEVYDQNEENLIEGEDIEAAQNLIGVSSRVFMEQLRGAAFRRKMDLARSRDSLVAKEQEQRKAIAASKKDEKKSGGQDETSTDNAAAPPSNPRLSFKALPLPSSLRTSCATGIPKVQKKPVTVPVSPPLSRRRKTFGNVPEIDSAQGQSEGPVSFKARPLPKVTSRGGLVGLEKVPKRPVTVPVSPQMGIKKSLSLVKQRKSTSVDESNQAEFKARPLPKTTGEFGQGGLSGVAKVPKRQVTVALSPLLGPRRLKPPPKLEKLSKLEPSGCVHSQLSSSELIGVDFVLTPVTRADENTPPLRTPPKRMEALRGGFIPRSTIRAQKRAEFDAARKEHEIEREEGQSLQLQGQIRELQEELNVLRDQI